MLLKILGVNLLLFAIYTLLITGNSSVADKGFNIAIGVGMCAFIQVVLNAVIGTVFLVLAKREYGKSFFISAAVLVPISFVTWLILLSIYG